MDAPLFQAEFERRMPRDFFQNARQSVWAGIKGIRRLFTEKNIKDNLHKTSEQSSQKEDTV
jgi:hypothetical protein